MKRICLLGLAVGLVLATTGCGEKDPNKDLKPISKDTPRPVGAGAGAAPAGPAAKAPSPPQ